IVIATTFATIVTAGLLWLCSSHRNGTSVLLARVAAFAARVGHLPGWTALPLGLGAGSLQVALLGMYWDISLHIDQGRDPGPLANPAHYLILFGLFGVWVAGFLAIMMGDSRGGSSTIERASTWKIPVGGIMLFACASFSL